MTMQTSLRRIFVFTRIKSQSLQVFTIDKSHPRGGDLTEPEAEGIYQTARFIDTEENSHNDSQQIRIMICIVHIKYLISHRNVLPVICC